MYKPGTKFRYLRIIILRHGRHLPARVIAERLNQGKQNICRVLNLAQMKPYIERLQADRGYWRRERRCYWFYKTVREMEKGWNLYRKPKQKRKRTRRYSPHLDPITRSVGETMLKDFYKKKIREMLPQLLEETQGRCNQRNA